MSISDLTGIRICNTALSSFQKREDYHRAAAGERDGAPGQEHGHIRGQARQIFIITVGEPIKYFLNLYDICKA